MWNSWCQELRVREYVPTKFESEPEEGVAHYFNRYRSSNFSTRNGTVPRKIIDGSNFDGVIIIDGSTFDDVSIIDSVLEFIPFCRITILNLFEDHVWQSIRRCCETNLQIYDHPSFDPLSMQFIWLSLIYYVSNCDYQTTIMLPIYYIVRAFHIIIYISPILTYFTFIVYCDFNFSDGNCMANDLVELDPDSQRLWEFGKIFLDRPHQVSLEKFPSLRDSEVKGHSDIWNI